MCIFIVWELTLVDVNEDQPEVQAAEATHFGWTLVPVFSGASSSAAPSGRAQSRPGSREPITVQVVCYSDLDVTVVNVISSQVFI